MKKLTIFFIFALTANVYFLISWFRSLRTTILNYPMCTECSHDRFIPKSCDLSGHDEIPSQIDQPEDQAIDRHQNQRNSDRAEILNLEENSEEEQYADLDSYLAHHNMYEASQYIHQQYRSHLHALDDETYYEEIDKLYDSYDTPATRGYRLANQAPGPHRTMEELMPIFRKGRGQTRRKELHGHRPFGFRMRSLQNHIQQKIKKNQRLRQRYTNTH